MFSLELILTDSPASIERIKLAAAFCNALGVALLSLGVFAPLIYQATALDSGPAEKRSILYGLIAICVIAGLTLHFVGLALLGFLNTSNVSETTNDRQ